MSVPVPTERQIELPAEPASVRKARQFVRQVLESWGLDSAVDNAVLLTSELATNSVLHARTRFSVVVSRRDQEVLVNVLDNSLVPPQHRSETAATATTGRGIDLMAKVATAWGASPMADLRGYAKGVWFAIPLTDR